MIKFSKETIRFVDDLIDRYSHYDRLAHQYTLVMDHIDRHDLKKLSALIMLDDSDYATECLSIENPFYEDTIKNAVIANFLGSMPDNYLSENIADAVIHYQAKSIQYLLEDRLFEYNTKDAA